MPRECAKHSSNKTNQAIYETRHKRVAGGEQSTKLTPEGLAETTGTHEWQCQPRGVLVGHLNNKRAIVTCVKPHTNKVSHDLMWLNNLRPAVDRQPWSPQEMTRKEHPSACSDGWCVPIWFWKPSGAAWIRKNLWKPWKCRLFGAPPKSVTPWRPWTNQDSSKTNVPGLLAVTGGSASKRCAKYVWQKWKRINRTRTISIFPPIVHLCPARLWAWTRPGANRITLRGTFYTSHVRWKITFLFLSRTFHQTITFFQVLFFMFDVCKSES